jgi:hypothetical protein
MFSEWLIEINKNTLQNHIFTEWTDRDKKYHLESYILWVTDRDKKYHLESYILWVTDRDKNTI